MLPRWPHYNSLSLLQKSPQATSSLLTLSWFLFLLLKTYTPLDVFLSPKLLSVCLSSYSKKRSSVTNSKKYLAILLSCLPKPKKNPLTQYAPLCNQQQNHLISNNLTPPQNILSYMSPSHCFFKLLTWFSHNLS